MNWKKYFSIPQEAKLSANCSDLIRKLMSDQSERLGNKGADEIKNHPFFQNVDWANLRKKRPPFIPDQTSLTKNFDKFEEEEPWMGTIEDNKPK